MQMVQLSRQILVYKYLKLHNLQKDYYQYKWFFFNLVEK